MFAISKPYGVSPTRKLAEMIRRGNRRRGYLSASNFLLVVSRWAERTGRSLKKEIWGLKKREEKIRGLSP